MKRFSTLMVLTLALWAAQAQDSKSADPAVLKVMSYNLKFASKTPPNSWPERRPMMARLLKAEAPDLIGTQEGVAYQLAEMGKDLQDYGWFGVGRDDGAEKGEFMAIFYKRDRLQPLSTNHFWLSGTPDVVGSATWGNAHRRLVTYAKFKDLRTGKEFYHWNTHFDHQVQAAREKSSDLIKTRVTALKTELPILLTGDFNALASSKEYSMLVENGFFKDTWKLARERVGEEYDTFNGFKGLEKKGNRIDWILARGSVEVFKTQIVTFSENDQFPSDHCPLVVWVKLN